MHFIPVSPFVTSTERSIRLRMVVAMAMFPASSFDLLRILKGKVSATRFVLLYRVRASPKETNAVPDSIAM